jgi:hypothetical protein
MMRRLAISSAILFAVVAVAMLAQMRPAAAASVPCKEVYGRGGGYVCGAGLDTRLMDLAYQPQQTPVGCLAVSMAMIIAYSGGNISASDVIASIFGANVPDTLSPDQVLPYLNHTYTSSADRSVTATTGSVLISSPIAGGRGPMRSIANQLTNEMPLLVFTSHNAMLLTSIYYYADLLGRPLRPYAVIVRDPFPYQGQPLSMPGVSLDGRPGERFLPVQDFNAIDHVFTVTVANH